MSDDVSARFGLPLLRAGQAQKEMAHNEALTRLDLALSPSVTAIGTNTPPASPAEGACWIVGGAPTGDWSGHAAAIAGWTGGGWRFVNPVEGMTVWSVGDSLPASFQGGSWSLGIIAAATLRIGGVQVIGAQQAAIADPSGGSVVDSQARTAIASILAVLRSHGLIAP